MSVIDDIWMGDCLNRQPSALFLYNYLLKNDSVKVLNINSPWGSGKTFFVERWQKELQLNHVCVSFNAWENDFSEEPLVSLVAAVNSQVKSIAGNTEDIRNGVANLVQATGRALKAASPVIAKGLLQRFSGINAHEITEATSAIASDAAEKALEELLKTHEQSTATVENFKASLSKLFKVATSAESTLQETVFIIIDELDRCRPTYAIELLERIKHFFAMENCKFIIASDTEQLSHAVRAVYGEGFDSPRYLKRFFDAEFTLNNDETHKFIAAQMDGNPNDVKRYGYFENIQARNNVYMGPFDDERTPSIDSKTVIFDEAYRLDVLYLAALAKFFQTNLREILKIVNQLHAMRDNANGQFYMLYAAFLLFLKDSDPTFYREMHSSLDWEQTSPLKLEEKLQRQVPNILFTRDKCTILQIANYYYSALNKSQRELSKSMEHVRGMQSEIINEVFNHADTIKQYPKLVDLAHRLS